MIEIGYVDGEEKLTKVLSLCYGVLGRETAKHPLYCPDAWRARMRDYGSLMLYAQEEGRITALVLARHESRESLVCGCVACRPGDRGRGITARLMRRLEINAKKLGYAYITLGAADGAAGFYEKYGYRQIAQTHGQRIFQKLL